MLPGSSISACYFEEMFRKSRSAKKVRTAYPHLGLGVIFAALVKVSAFKWQNIDLNIALAKRKRRNISVVRPMSISMTAVAVALLLLEILG